MLVADLTWPGWMDLDQERDKKDDMHTHYTLVIFLFVGIAEVTMISGLEKRREVKAWKVYEREKVLKGKMKSKSREIVHMFFLRDKSGGGENGDRPWGNFTSVRMPIYKTNHCERNIIMSFVLL